MSNENCKDCEFIKDLDKRVFELENPPIINSVGVKGRLNRKEFDQKNYDKPSEKHVMEKINEAIKNVPNNMKRNIMVNLKDLSVILGMIVIIIKLFGGE